MYTGLTRQPISRDEYLRRQLLQLSPIYVDNVLCTVEKIKGVGIAPTREEYLRTHLLAIHDDCPPCESKARVGWNSRVHCLDCGVDLHDMERS